MFCSDIHAPSTICTKPLGLGLHALCEAIIALIMLPGGSSGFVRRFGVLSNMTSALNAAAFEFPAHAASSSKFKYLPSLLCGASFFHH